MTIYSLHVIPNGRRACTCPTHHAAAGEDDLFVRQTAWSKWGFARLETMFAACFGNVGRQLRVQSSRVVVVHYVGLCRKTGALRASAIS
jgi:hypothetical protein